MPTTNASATTLAPVCSAHVYPFIHVHVYMPINHNKSFTSSTAGIAVVSAKFSAAS